MASALSGGGITSKVDVTYLNYFLKEFNAVSRAHRERGMVHVCVFSRFKSAQD